LYTLAAMSGATNSAIFQRATNGDIIVIIIIIFIKDICIAQDRWNAANAAKNHIVSKPDIAIRFCQLKVSNK